MKKLIGLSLMLCMIFVLAACGNGGTETPPTTPPADTGSGETPPADTTPVAPAEAFPGKVAIVTSAVDQNEEEYRSGQQLVDKYGEDKIVHVTWPANFMNEQEQMITIVGRLASDPEIKGLVINQSVPGTIAAIDKLLETRDDIFICMVQTQENPPDAANRANMVLYLDEYGYAPVIIQQAQSMGAKTFVHYSFPRHMSQPLLSGRRDLMMAECEKLGVEFVNATAPDPTSDVGVAGAQQFILEDVPKMIAQYGPDTAFFSTNCAMQIPLIKAASDGGGIYPMPCCPSPYHGYPSALGISVPEDGLADIDYMIGETARILKEKNVLGRFSSTPVPIAMMETNVGAEYAIKWINGEVPQEKGVVDLDVLSQLMADYSGTDAIRLRTYDEADAKLDNFVLVLMDLYTYSESDIK